MASVPFHLINENGQQAGLEVRAELPPQGN